MTTPDTPNKTTSINGSNVDACTSLLELKARTDECLKPIGARATIENGAVFVRMNGQALRLIVVKFLWKGELTIKDNDEVVLSDRKARPDDDFIWTVDRAILSRQGRIRISLRDTV